MMNGAMIAPQDCVENASPVCAPLAWKLAARNVPSVTNQQPQMKNCRNIITLSRALDHDRYASRPVPWIGIFCAAITSC